MAEQNAVFVEERQNRILQMLSQDQKILVDDLVEIFGVSHATIRNDLNRLSERGLLKRTHGGAVSIAKVNFEQNNHEKRTSRLPEKRSIAACANKLIEDGDTIILDTGSTLSVFAEVITAKHLTVVTNDLDIALAMEKHDDCRVVLLGGVVRNGYHCTLGPSAVEQLKALHVDKAFVATNSITAKDGLSTPDLNHADIKRRMIASADRTILLATGNKFGRKSFAHFADTTELDVIVTDASIPEDELNAIRALNVEVILA